MQKSTLIRFGCVAALALTVAGCQQGYNGGYNTGLSPDVTRAAGGAVAGALTAKVLDGDVATGALFGGAAGALCDDFGVCQ